MLQNYKFTTIFVTSLFLLVNIIAFIAKASIFNDITFAVSDTAGFATTAAAAWITADNNIGESTPAEDILVGASMAASITLLVLIVK